MLKITKNISSLLILVSFSFISFAKINKKKGIALDGTDVVAYFNKGQKKAAAGKKEFSTQHNQTTYYFSSKANLEKFKTDPNKYLPAYGGHCAWAVGESSEYVPVDYDSFLIENDESGKERLLLFYNKFFINTKTKWSKKAKKSKEGSVGLINKADMNWKKMTGSKTN